MHSFISHIIFASLVQPSSRFSESLELIHSFKRLFREGSPHENIGQGYF